MNVHLMTIWMLHLYSGDSAVTGVMDDDGPYTVGLSAITESVSHGGERDRIPTSIHDALNGVNGVHWRQSCGSEMAQFAVNHCFEPVQFEERMRPHMIKSHWVFDHKLGPTNLVIKYKARYVMGGDAQVHGVHYWESSSPTGSMDSLRMLLHIGAVLDLEIQQVDFVTAFLNSPLDEEIYIHQIPGYEETYRGDKSIVLKLKKAIYGLKQAGLAWYQLVDELLKSIGFSNLVSDQCVYSLTVGAHFIAIWVYVDDMIILYDKSLTDTWISIKQQIHDTYPITDIGECKYVLRMSIIRDRTNRLLWLSQQPYVLKVLTETGHTLATAGSCPTPSIQTDVTERDDTELLSAEQRKLYQEHTGMVGYIAGLTHVEIMCSVGRAQRRVAAPTVKDWKALQRIIKYLKTVVNYALMFGDIGDGALVNGVYSPVVHVLTDSDYANDVADRQCTSGVLSLMGCDTVSASSRKQGVTTSSSCEAEVVASVAGVHQLLFIRNFLTELFPAMVVRYKLWGDNEGAIAVARNAGSRGKTKHMDVRYCVIRQELAAKKFTLHWIPSQQQLADQLTKPLSGESFSYQRARVLTEEGVRRTTFVLKEGKTT